jgi:hypothetical protein
VKRRDHIASIYGPNTEGMELPEPGPELTPEQQMAKDAEYVGRQKAKANARCYSGRPIEATRLFTRRLQQFKNTDAAVLVAVNDHAGTVTYLNTYRAGELPASYDPKYYTFQINEKKLAKKIEQMAEVEVTEWPPFVAPAVRSRRGRGKA